MTSDRANLNNSGQNSTYIVLTLILITLSIVGLVLFFQLKNSQPKLIPAADTAVVYVTPTEQPIVFPTEVVEATPTPAFKTFASDTDKFTVIYKSFRQLYQDKEAGGNRYTFYSSQGNITVHAGASWSWVYPDRQFSQSLLVSGYPTFVYEINSQTIVDFKVGEQLFTIQCVHHNDSTLKSECQQFLTDFKTN